MLQWKTQKIKKDSVTNQSGINCTESTEWVIIHIGKPGKNSSPKHERGYWKAVVGKPQMR